MDALGVQLVDHELLSSVLASDQSSERLTDETFEREWDAVRWTSL